MSDNIIELYNQMTGICWWIRTVKFWDLESMQLVCSTDADSTPARFAFTVYILHYLCTSWSTDPHKYALRFMSGHCTNRLCYGRTSIVLKCAAKVAQSYFQPVFIFCFPVPISPILCLWDVKPYSINQSYFVSFSDQSCQCIRVFKIAFAYSRQWWKHVKKSK